MTIRPTWRNVAAAAVLLASAASQAAAYEPIMLEKLGAVRMGRPDAPRAEAETATTTRAAPLPLQRGGTRPELDSPMIMLERLGAVRMARPEEIPTATPAAQPVEVASMEER